MEVGGVIKDAFHIVLGNPDIMIGLISFAVLSTLVLTTISMFDEGVKS